MPLHASVFGLNGSAVALAGPSGAGKSTLAALLAARGHEVLTDDICVVDAVNEASVLPSTPRLRLWRDALDYLGIAAEGLPRAFSRREKYLIEGSEWAGTAPRKLAAIVLLSRKAGGAVAIERLRGAHSIFELQEVVHMLPAARALTLDSAIFAALTNLLGFGVTVWRLAMPDDRACLDAAAAKILSVLDG
jgi:hypothetical protein